jgi:hypothetical protein
MSVYPYKVGGDGVRDRGGSFYLTDANLRQNIPDDIPVHLLNV